MSTLAEEPDVTPPTPGSWDYVGGWEDDDAIGLNIAYGPRPDGSFKGARVRVPVSVVDGDLVVGTPEIL